MYPMTASLEGAIWVNSQPSFRCDLDWVLKYDTWDNLFSNEHNLVITMLTF